MVLTAEQFNRRTSRRALTKEETLATIPFLLTMGQDVGRPLDDGRPAAAPVTEGVNLG